MRSALIFLGIVALAAATPIPFTNCGSSTDLLSVSSIDISPYPPKKGDTIAVSFEGTLSAGFSAASWAATVKWSIFTKNYNGDVCTELAKTGHPCPLNAGPQTIVASLATGGAPSGTFNVQATAKTSDGKQIMCTQFHFEINSNNQIVASTPSATAIQLALEAQESGPIECAACQFTIDKLQELVQNSSTLDSKVEDFLQNDFCTLLPTSAQALCNATVAQETPAILADIAQKLLNGTTDCAKLGLCPAPHATVNVGGMCDVCEKAVAWIDNYWFNNTQAQTLLVQEIEAICNIFPASIQVPCDAAANQTAPALMQKIGDFLATEGCKDIHLCN